MGAGAGAAITKRITAESSKKGFNITISPVAGVGDGHLAAD
jgi:hypothetical protein